MATFTALYDACVLYPAPLRDLLMRLALTNLFRARWTDRIHEEWIEALLKQRSDLKRKQLERTKKLMNSHVRDCLVTGYEPLIEGLELPGAADPRRRRMLVRALVRMKAPARESARRLARLTARLTLGASKKSALTFMLIRGDGIRRQSLLAVATRLVAARARQRPLDLP